MSFTKLTINFTGIIKSIEIAVSKLLRVCEAWDAEIKMKYILQ